jgi:hypothetical protein
MHSPSPRKVNNLCKKVIIIFMPEHTFWPLNALDDICLVLTWPLSGRATSKIRTPVEKSSRPVGPTSLMSDVGKVAWTNKLRPLSEGSI